MSECVIISGTLEAKLRNKLFAYFHQRYVELVYVENENNNNTVTSGYYEMRLYKTKNKSASSLYSFKINPIAMTCYINYLNSNKHQFTFVCSSQQTSICFSAHTKYERDAWISVLEQLQWQCEPNTESQQEISHSNTTISRSPDTKHTESDDDLCINNTQPTSENMSSIISLTQQQTSNDNVIIYNYYNSNLYITEKHANKDNHQCCCKSCDGQKFTILGLLNDQYKNSGNNCNHIGQLQAVKSPKYKAMQYASNILPVQC